MAHALALPPLPPENERQAHRDAGDQRAAVLAEPFLDGFALFVFV